MIGGPEEPSLTHDWRCTRPVPEVSRDRSPDGTLTITHRCPWCGATAREEA